MKKPNLLRPYEHIICYCYIEYIIISLHNIIHIINGSKATFFRKTCSIFVPALYPIVHNGNSVTQFSLNASRATRAATAEQSEVAALAI